MRAIILALSITSVMAILNGLDLVGASAERNTTVAEIMREID